MRVEDPGHLYRLRVLDGEEYGMPAYPLKFVKREGLNYPGNEGHYPGTTSQEVLRALINRAGYVQGQIPCWQTNVSIYPMSLVVWLYEHRAAKRHKRRPPSLYDAIYGETCSMCGHVGCYGDCH